MEKTNSYSALFIIVPEKEESIDELKSSISSVISDNSGNIVGENMVGKKALAYPIQKKTQGIYYEVTFTALPGSVAKIMRQFQINTDILRALIDKND
jgi:small subunit ribosomal protein S6